LKKLLLLFFFQFALNFAFSSELPRYFLTSDSVKIGFVQYGKINSPNLIFVHGGPGDNSSDFRSMAKRLSPYFHVTLFDARGCGFSERNISFERLNVANYVNDIKELMDHLQIKKTILLGHSFGGAIAIEFGLIYPERITKLILSNPLISCKVAQFNRFHYSFDFALKEKDTVKINTYKKFIAGDSITIWDEFKMVDPRLTWFNPEIMDSAFAKDYISMGYTDYTVEPVFDLIFNYYETGFFPNYSVIDKLNELKTETIIIATSHDMLITYLDLNDAKKLIPNCTFKIIFRSGHFPFLEQPDSFLYTVYESVNSSR
jgi:pimeloyl-ACP methyl ester carboxylesterase